VVLPGARLRVHAAAGCRRPAAAGLRGATATVLVLLPELQRLLSGGAVVPGTVDDGPRAAVLGSVLLCAGPPRKD